MSTLKADAVTTKTDDTDLTLTGGGTGVPNLEAGFKVGGSAGVPTASVQDDAITLAKLAAGTDGELITWDASGDPATVAVGTATHVLTSNGVGAAPTFQAAAGGGAWTLIGTSTASTSASLTQTGLDSTYDTYAIICSNIAMDDAGARLRFRVGDSGGIDSGASDYKYVGWQQVSSGGATMEGFVNTTSYIQLGPNNGIATVAHMICYLTIGNTPLLTASILLNDGNARATTLMGYRDSAITLTQVQILPSTSTIASGRLTVWGIKYT